jgi:transposase-like protein
VIYLDGLIFGDHHIVAAVGVEYSENEAHNGRKHVLGIAAGASENLVVVQGLLERLVERGLDPQRRYLFVIDGSKALRAAIHAVFGAQNPVQRCQIHKRRNVKDHLPEGCRADYDRQLRNAYAMTRYEDAKAALEKLFRQLERINPSAARSLRKGWRKRSPCTAWAWAHCCAAAFRRPTSSSRAFPPSGTWPATSNAGRAATTSLAGPPLGCWKRRRNSGR